jgi:RNA polymerase sigma factor (sigma-70 family)
MNNPDYAKLSRKQLLEQMEIERQEWLALGMTEADVYRMHFGEEHEGGKGGDYAVWLSERRHTRSDRKYAPGTPVAIDTADPDGVWIHDRRSSPDAVEFNVDLEAALSTLTELQRFCFVEVAVNDRTQQSVADELQIAQQTVDRHIRAAKKKLQKIFQG